MSRPPKDPELIWGSAEWMRLYRAGIKKTEEGSYVISSNQVWRPGAFATEKAARMGQRRLDEEIQELQDEVNAKYSEEEWTKRVITEEMLEAKPRWPKAPVKDCWRCNEPLYGGGRYFVVVEIDGERRYLHRPCADQHAHEPRP